MYRNKNIFVDIAADGLESAVITSTGLDAAEYGENVKRYISAYLTDTPVGTMLFNVCYKRSVIASDVFDTLLYNVAPDGTKTEIPECSSTPMLSRYREMLRRDIDIVRMAVDETKAYGAEAWFTFRMNDHHYPDDPSFNSSFSYDNADKYGVNGSRYYMDWSNEAVREHYKAYILEVCAKYPIDGILLDFLRSCPIMAQPDCEIMNSFMREMRAEVNKIAEMRGRSFGLGVRIHAEEEQNLGYGIDAAQWVADGSVDVVAPEAFYIPTFFDIPADKWRESIDERNVNGNQYTLLCGTDWGVRCDANAGGRMMWLTLEQLKGFASGVYSKGADGIYLFNHFSTDGDTGALTYYLGEDGSLTAKNVLGDKLRAINSLDDAESGLRVHVKTCRDYHNKVYPAAVTSGESVTFEVYTGSAPSDGTYTVVIGLDDNCDDIPEVTLNGYPLAYGGIVRAANGFEWTDSDAREPVAKHVSEVAPRVLSFTVDDLSAVNDGSNTVTFTNGGNDTIYIKWLEIQIDNYNNTTKRSVCMEENNTIAAKFTPYELAEKIIRALDSKKARGIKLLHVEKQTVLTDYFIICSGTSNTQLKTLAGEVEFQLAEAGVELRHMDGYTEASWIVQDFGSVIVHIFNSETRNFYNLEKLWIDSTEVDIKSILIEE